MPTPPTYALSPPPQSSPPHRMYLLAVGVIRVRTQLPAYFCLRLGVLGSLVVSSLVFDVAPTRCRGGLHLRCSFYGYQTVHEQCRHRAMLYLRPVLNAVRLRISLLDVKFSLAGQAWEATDDRRAAQYHTDSVQFADGRAIMCV